jgi:phosphoribosylglycinamide formyltransferase-1
VEREVRIGVLASGRGSNFEALWRAAQRRELQARVVCLVSDRHDAPCLKLAEEWDLPRLCVAARSGKARLPREQEEEIVAYLRQHDVDLVCLAGFMRIVGKTLLDAFPGAMLNIHPSLLPSFPGLAAQQQALEHGVKVAGCSVHFVDAGVDSGPIIVQAPVEVQEEDTPETLAARILEKEHVIYPLAVRLWATGRLQIQGRRVHIVPPGCGNRGPIREESF